MKRHFVFLCLIVLTSCAGSTTSTNNDVAKNDSVINSIVADTVSEEEIFMPGGHNPGGPDTSVCGKLLTDFMRRSSFEPPVDGVDKNTLSTELDGVEDSVLHIKVLYRDSSSYIPYGWLNFDLRSRSLTDVSPTHDEPFQLSFDSTSVEALLEQCSFTETE